MHDYEGHVAAVEADGVFDPATVRSQTQQRGAVTCHMRRKFLCAVGSLTSLRQ